MSFEDKPVVTRVCDSCKQEYGQYRDEPCDTCRGLLCSKCCGVLELLVERTAEAEAARDARRAAEEEFVASRLAASLPLYDEALVHWDDAVYPVPRAWKKWSDEYRKREAEAMLDLECAIARLLKDGE